MWKQFFTLPCTFLFAIGAHSQIADPVLLGLDKKSVALPGHIEWLEDDGRQMTLDEVRAKSRWAIQADTPAASFTHSAIWLRFKLKQSATAENDWVLSVDDTQLDEVQLHLALPNGQWTVQRAGRLVDRSAWPLDSRTPAFHLRLPAGESKVYLRLQSQHSLTPILHLRSMVDHLQKSNQEALLFGTYFGIFLTTILLQVFFWLIAQDIVSGWYLLYSLMLLTITLLRAGYPQTFLGLHQPTANLLGVISNLAPMVVVRLTAVWLELKRHAPRFNILYQGSAYSISLITGGMVLMGDHARGLQIGQTLTLLWFVISFTLSFWLWRRRISGAGLYMVIFGSLELWVAARFMRNLGWLPVNFWTEYAVSIGVIAHLFLMSLYFIFRYRALQSNLAAEQRAREEQRDFVSMVSHEFRTPLAIIHTSVQQLASNLNAPAERSLQRTQNIRDAIQRMNVLLDEYLSLDRLNTTQQALKMRACDFYEVIEEAASDWPVGRIQIRLDRFGGNFVCDPDLMCIVLRNLLSNAVRHSPESTEVKLEVAAQNDQSLHISVQDCGDGIPADELPRLFDRYFRGRGSQGKPGAGLGLHLARRIVQLHGGTISVKSTVGQGTDFFITLPRGKLPNS